jgi:uracil-DNA glycosylase family 4
LQDEWLTEPCRLANGKPAPRPIVWSRRNGPWRQSDLLWVGAAPGNAGGKGAGQLGAHGTRIPFGGDIAGANLDALLGSIGLDRNRTFISASYNKLPAAGGGEPTSAELRAPVGDFPSSYHLVRAVIVAVGPRLIVLLGNVAARVVMAAARLHQPNAKVPSLRALQQCGLQRNQWRDWPDGLLPDEDFITHWNDAWGSQSLPRLLWLTHPSAQNMSPYARPDTLFHLRFLEARDALRAAVQATFGHTLTPRLDPPPATGIYALPEWRELIGPRHQELIRLWRNHGIEG